MNYDFFASDSDKIQILNFIFTETDLQVFDLSSTPGGHVNEYKNTAEIASKFDLVNGDRFSITFQIWSPRFEAKPIFRKVELNPKYCNGHTFRYATEGLGLIQLYFGGLQNNIVSRSHIGHLSQKRALIFQDDNPSMGKANDWNWLEIEKTSRHLKYQIHNKIAIKKIGSVGVLKGAETLELEGFKLA